MYNLCSSVFGNGNWSQIMRGCLQVFYVPGAGYISIPVLIPSPTSGSWIDLDSISLFGLGAHLVWAINATNVAIGQ
jgi:hypothetical protein